MMAYEEELKRLQEECERKLKEWDDYVPMPGLDDTAMYATTRIWRQYKRDREALKQKYGIN